jgi:hypothetical protein
MAREGREEVEVRVKNGCGALMRGGDAVSQAGLIETECGEPGEKTASGKTGDWSRKRPFLVLIFENDHNDA